MIISERIQKIISYYGYSLSEFADTIEVARAGVSHIMSGRNRPSLDFIIKVKNRFPEIRLDWLINGDGEMTKEKKNLSKHNTNSTARPPLDLFSLSTFEDKKYSPPENFQIVNSEKTNEKNIYNDTSENIKTANHDNLQKNHEKISEGKKASIERIVFFFDDGKFEVFDK